MRATIDRAGRVVVPKQLRDEIGLDSGGELEIFARDGTLVLEPLPTPVSIVRRGKTFVAKPRAPVTPLTQAQVRAVLEGSRR